MGLFTPDTNTLRELYIEQLRKALNMEKQIVEKGLPSMIENSTNPDLKNAFRTHLEESRGHIARLEEILQETKGEVSEATCKVISALISEGGSAAEDAGDETVRDVVLIAAGNQVEHHEIAVYGTLATWADILGEAGHAELLEQTLDEEKSADELLTSLAEQVNVEAPAV